jgi:predicted DNA-binding protein (MmcQ/YjbR family)
MQEIAMGDTPKRTSERATGNRAARTALRDFALGLPGAYEEFPWGECVVKVNKRVFVFLGIDTDHDTGLSFSIKLPISGEDVLALPFTEPTGYGLGKHGWVTVSFLPGEQPPIDVLRGWIVESYRAIAPKRLVAQLEQQSAR